MSKGQLSMKEKLDEVLNPSENDNLDFPYEIRIHLTLKEILNKSYDIKNEIGAEVECDGLTWAGIVNNIKEEFELSNPSYTGWISLNKYLHYVEDFAEQYITYDGKDAYFNYDNMDFSDPESIEINIPVTVHVSKILEDHTKYRTNELSQLSKLSVEEIKELVNYYDEPTRSTSPTIEQARLIVKNMIQDGFSDQRIRTIGMVMAEQNGSQTMAADFKKVLEEPEISDFKKSIKNKAKNSDKER